jgi:hypothetical protein
VESVLVPEHHARNGMCSRLRQALRSSRLPPIRPRAAANPDLYAYVVENVRQGDPEQFTLRVLGGNRLRHLLKQGKGTAVLHRPVARGRLRQLPRRGCPGLKTRGDSRPARQAAQESAEIVLCGEGPSGRLAVAHRVFNIRLDVLDYVGVPDQSVRFGAADCRPIPVTSG